MLDRSQITHENEDPESWKANEQENRRQEFHIELIASENYTSPALMAAQGTQLTNKYAEGYPGKRYYGGFEFVDVVERLALPRVMKLFHAEAPHVPPPSRAPANPAGVFPAPQPCAHILALTPPPGRPPPHPA